MTPDQTDPWVRSIQSILFRDLIIFYASLKMIDLIDRPIRLDHEIHVLQIRLHETGTHTCQTKTHHVHSDSNSNCTIQPPPARCR